MKYLIITGVFILGLSLGYIVGTQTSGESAQNEESVAMSNLSGNNNGGNHHDHANSNHDSESDELLVEVDTSELNPGDSLNAEFMVADSLLNEDHISTEKLVKSVSLSLVYLSEEVEKDTAIKEMLGIDEVKNNSVYVEFWQSPLNFEGYKLSRKKLIVYGLSPQFDYKFYKDGSSYFLSYQNVYLKMKETQDFLPFVEVSKGEVFND